ncbi:MAG: type II secretion system protein GspG [Oligoflexia bacterium]|nr:type II secretion system protein GspG [Oligoflexia bacterium]
MNQRHPLLSHLLRNERGLTLVEIIVVLIILGVLISVLGGKIFNSKDRALADLTRVSIKSTQNSIEEFRLRYNGLPNSIEDLSSCSERTGAGCIPIAKEDDLKDAWGNRLVYSVDNGGRSYRIKSFGADGREGGANADSDIVITGP